MKLFAMIASTLTVALSGCATPEPVQESPLTYCTNTAPSLQAQCGVAEQLSLDAHFYYKHPDRTNVSSAPTSGQATYSGFTRMHNPDDMFVQNGFNAYPQYHGEITIQADFGAGTLSGEASQFLETLIVYEDSPTITLDVTGTVEGTLILEGGTIDSNLGTFQNLTMSGTLTGSDGVATDMHFVFGDHFETISGGNPDLINAYTWGTMTINGVVVTSGAFAVITAGAE